METPGSDVSSDSSDSSSADPPSAESTRAQIVSRTSEKQTSPPTNHALVEQDDSDSDISMSAETDDEDDEHPRLSTIQVNPVGRTLELPNLVAVNASAAGSNKRKCPGPEDEPINGQVNGSVQEVRKRLKPDNDFQNNRTPEGHLRQDKSLLPAEIWHHIFTFIPPRNLGLLLRVNKCFNAYLDPSSSESSIAPLSRSVARVLKPDGIWRASRRLFRPGMPAPLIGSSELDMWKLACSLSCQFCGKKQLPNLLPRTDQWHPGPGENGVLPIWCFGIRTCGPCLRQRSSKEIDLLLSSSVPTPLMAALPFVFLTNELHVLSATTLQNGQPPPTFQIQKYFFQVHIEDVKREFTEVQSMGSATAEEWLKGLDNRGKERRSDAARWERWDVSGGVVRMLNMEPHEVLKSGLPTRTFTPSATTTNLLPPTNSHAPVFQVRNSIPVPAKLPSQVHKLPQPIHTSFAPPPRFDSPAQNGFAAHLPRQYPPTRHERTKEEVAELKAARRAEIERRCMQLDPPLTAGVLAHMGSFQAAIQIIQPLDDSAWEVLKPRLLSQREDAEQREQDRLAQSRVVQEHFDQDVNIKSESKDVLDREWDDIQAPLRARLGGYADEIIRDGWNGGEKVSKDNCPTFAAEVLIYVRKRFYAEVAKDEAAVRATGREPEMDPLNGPYTRKLILENMKWVFDTRIKPHTEPYRKELFLCNDCCETNFKFYGFEGVIQHYAAKHTNALSVGSIVVHWKSEWPEYPPFNPEPALVISSGYATGPSASVPYAATGPTQNYGYGGYQPVPVSTTMQVPNPHVYQESPGPYYGHPQFGEQYPGHQNGPYAPPPPPQPQQVYQENSQSYQGPQYSGPPPVGAIPGYNDPPQDYSQQGFGGPYPATSQEMYTSPQTGPLYPATVPEVAPQQQPYAPQGGQYGYNYNQSAPPPVHPNSQFTPAPQKTEEYKTHLQEVARNARAIWDSINSLKDVPGSVKVYTIIYHVLQRSRAKFEEDPPLAMIVDGLSNNKDMRKVRNINGLLCKACKLGLPGAASAKRQYSFPQLANHFYKDHDQAVSQNNLGTVPDWTKDMVDLPDFSRIASIASTRGMDDKKLKLIAEALPEIFSAPRTRNDHLDRSGHSGAPRDGIDQEPFGLAPSQDNHEKYYTAMDSGRPSESNSVAYDSEQYDPRNPQDPRDREPHGDVEPTYRITRRPEDSQKPLYDRVEWSRIEQRPVSPPPRLRSVDPYGRVIVRDEVPLYLDKPVRYRDEGGVEYRIRRDPPMVTYEDPDPTVSGRDHRPANARLYQSNRHDSQPPLGQEVPARESRYLPAEEAAAQQSRIFEVVAQISHQAQQARENPAIEEPVDVGSEDGELRTHPISDPEPSRSQAQKEASNAAERFLDEFVLGETSEEVAKKAEDAEHQAGHSRARWENERMKSTQRIYEHPPEPQRHVRERDVYEEGGRVVASRGRPINPATEDPAYNGYVVHERVSQPRQGRAYTYDDRYVDSVPEHAATRERSPELVDRRYKRNNVVYRDERQSSHGTHRTASRYARYESVRLENDRARSRSPVYVKMGPQPGQLRERSPGAQPLHQEPVYRTRTPQAPSEEVTYERAPRQEYYRVYADESRPRQPQYVETFEYVQVSDPNGDYMIRRPVRREPEPIYARYEDETYSRQPVYESRAPVSRSDPAYYEEYDPRHPAPPPAAPVRQVRYQ